MILENCNVYLPLISPKTHPGYFPIDVGGDAKQKLSGAVAIMLAYRSENIATSVPRSLYDVYHQYFDPANKYDPVFGYASDHSAAGGVGDDGTTKSDFLYTVYDDPYTNTKTLTSTDPKIVSYPTFGEALHQLLLQIENRR
jgi:hypothetical protein